MPLSDDSEGLNNHPRKTKNVSVSERSRKMPSSSTSFASNAIDLDDCGDSSRLRKKTKTGRIEWSDSDGEEAGAAAYKRFKQRGAVARKRALASTKRAKAIDAENHPPLRESEEGHTGVGRQAKKKSRRQRTPKYDDLPSDDEGMDHTLPDYLQERRNHFNERSEMLKAAGLMLPPYYDEVYFSDNERIKILKERPDLPHITPPAPYKDIELPYSLGIIPAPIARYLREYQVKGAAFLHELFVYQKGGILGDDMGLGKTIQVIAFLTAAYGKTADERDNKRMRKMRRADLFYPRTLIICPGSLMGNWQDELNRWGWWHTDLFHGSSKQREDVLDQARAGMLEIMITTYTTYRIYASAINTIAWDCVIADECHIIKERRSEITKSLNHINALCRIGLTGTAIQNKYEELWTILNWSCPGRFGPLSTWKITISEPLKLGQSHNASVHELARARKTARQLVENLLPQFFLRRMKSLIREQLPKKTDRVVFCPLTPAQADAYQNFINSDYVQTIKDSSEMCDCGSGKKSGWCCRKFLENGDAWQAWVFPCIAHLQRLSNHLALLIPSSNDTKDKQAKDTELIQTALPDSWAELVETRDSILNFSNPSFCGKWRVLKRLLKFWHESGNNKVLVFSHSVRLLRMLQALFIHTSYSMSYLDGSMSYEDRYAAVADFNSDPTQFVFLISTRAGGVGLNITSANKVVVVDPNWNPSYDLQAQDRAYRIGQTRDVEVFRLVSQGTLEEIVYARQVYKQQMSSIGLSATSERRYFTGVQDRKDQKGEIFGLHNLFAYQDDNVVLRDIVHKTNVAESKADLKIAEMNIDDDESGEIEPGDYPASDDDLLGTTTTHYSRNDSQTALETEDAFMSQLAASITGETKMSRSRIRRGVAGESALATSFGGTISANSDKKRHDPIRAILSSAGVVYTHENSEVIGSSRVEAALSKRAEEADTQTRSNPAFMDGSQNRNQFPPNDIGIQYRYRPPEDVVRRQFCSMARWAGYEGEDEEGIVDFALAVESWTQSERREFLEDFYRWRRHHLVTADSETSSGKNNDSGQKRMMLDGDGVTSEREDLVLTSKIRREFSVGRKSEGAVEENSYEAMIMRDDDEDEDDDDNAEL